MRKNRSSCARSGSRRPAWPRGRRLELLERAGHAPERHLVDGIAQTLVEGHPPQREREKVVREGIPLEVPDERLRMERGTHDIQLRELPRQPVRRVEASRREHAKAVSAVVVVPELLAVVRRQGGKELPRRRTRHVPLEQAFDVPAKIPIQDRIGPPLGLPPVHRHVDRDARRLFLREEFLQVRSRKRMKDFGRVDGSLPPSGRSACSSEPRSSPSRAAAPGKQCTLTGRPGKGAALTPAPASGSSLRSTGNGSPLLPQDR